MESGKLPLPVQLHSKLELARIVGRRWQSRNGPQLVHVRHIETVGDIEHVSNRVQTEALAEVDTACDAEIIEYSVGLHSGITAEVAIQRLERAVEAAGITRQLKSACG